MKNLKEAKRLAGIFISTTGLKKAGAGITELGTLCSLMKESPELKALLVSPLFGADERDTALQAINKKLKLSGGTVKFLTHISGLGAAGLLDDITRIATRIYFDRIQMSRATVITATAVSGSQERKLGESVRALAGREVEITYETDPSLMGGVLVKVGSTMFDSTIKGQLGLIKEELLKG